MVRLLARNRNLVEGAILALVLPFIAGAINASGFFIVGVYTSHVTGSVARIGDELAQGKVAAALAAGALVVAFYGGTVAATVLVDAARKRKRARYAAALLAEIATLVAVTALGGSQAHRLPWAHTLTTSLLCGAMGVQNALVTKLSGAVVRTTHLTGTVTDLGIETVRVAWWMRHATAGRSPWKRARKLWRARQHPELKKLRLHLGIVGSFLTGAFAGPWVYLHHGHLSMLFPVALLLGLVAFDVALGFRPQRRPAPAPVSAARPPSSGPRLAA